MTPDEIRAASDQKFPQTDAWLREIAAQLAEQVQQLRTNLEQSRLWREEDQAANKKRDAIMAGLAETQAKMGESFSPPQPVRVEFPGTVQHLGCIICEPDGTHKIATNQGRLIELKPAEAANLLALMCEPTADDEAKPQ